MASSSEKPHALEIPKKKREEDHEYIRWIHSWPCCVCGRYPVHAHHAKTRGSGGADRSAVPLCPDHHVASGRSVHTLGLRTFEKTHHVSLDEQVERFNKAYNEGLKGPYFHFLPETVRAF